MKFQKLFQPIKIGGMEVKNRFVKPPMGSNLAEDDHSVGQRMIDYYTECAKGGFGLINVEICAVDQAGCSIIREAAIWDDKFIDGYRKLADSVHANGGKLCIQLHHAGKATNPSKINGVLPIAPSPLPDEHYAFVPHEMTTAEVYEMVDKFADAAERAKIAGADAVEVHGAHGYLIAQFMSSSANCRNDEFGGSFENRMRFPKLIVEAIRKRLGDAFPILFRISGVEGGVGGRGLAESRAAVKMMEAAGVNAFHVSVGQHNEFYRLKAASDSPLAYLAYLAEEMKKAVSVPVIAVGRINDPYIAEELVESGIADLVALGRQSIADPHFPNKVKEGKLDEIVYCVGCHIGCSEELTKNNHCITCALNPFAGRGAGLKIEPAPVQKNIMVVGGGPGGMEAAWVMAKRGHQVTLYEKTDKLGGNYRVAAYPPGKSELVKALNYYHTMCNKYGVTIKTGVEVTPALIAVEHPDAVILATGSVPFAPPIKGVDNKSFAKANDILLGNVLAGKKVLVAGGGLVGVETADFLGCNGRDVTIIEMKPIVAFDVPAVVAVTLMPRLKEHNVKLETNAVIKELLDDGVVFERDGKVETLRGFDSIVLAMGARPYNPLEAKIKDIVPEVYVIGDAAQPARIMEATSAAVKIGLSI